MSPGLLLQRRAQGRVTRALSLPSHSHRAAPCQSQRAQRATSLMRAVHLQADWRAMAPAAATSTAIVYMILLPIWLVSMGLQLRARSEVQLSLPGEKCTRAHTHAHAHARPPSWRATLRRSALAKARVLCFYSLWPTPPRPRRMTTSRPEARLGLVPRRWAWSNQANDPAWLLQMASSRQYEVSTKTFVVDVGSWRSCPSGLWAEPPCADGTTYSARCVRVNGTGGGRSLAERP